MSEEQMGLFDPDRAALTKKQGMADADAHADPSWKVAALAAIKEVATQHAYFTADDVWEWLAVSGSTAQTHEPAALGPVMLAACRRGWIAKTDQWEQTKIPRRHRALLVWESLLDGRAELSR